MEDDMATGLNASFISEFFMQILNYLQVRIINLFILFILYTFLH